MGLGGLAAWSDDEIADAVADASLPALLPALAWLLGDVGLLDPALRPDPALIRDEQAGLTAEQQETIRATAVRVLRTLRDAPHDAPPRPGGALSESLLVAAMEQATGSAISADHAALMAEELAATDEDMRAPRWTVRELAPGRTLRVAVVGAGMSGLLAAHRLRQAGVDVVVLEKNDDLGGTWKENTYPGCRVDVANHLYSYSCAQRTDWPYHFSPQAELLAYFRTCAEQFGVVDFIRFGTTVEEMNWDGRRWHLRLSGPGCDADDATVTADAVVSAVGQLNRPKMPVIEGLQSFGGESFHSARWDWSVELEGKRVAVVGSAASAAQLLPWVAERAEHVDLYQRTPNWFVPVPNYHEPVPGGMRRLFEGLPGYAQWYRFWLFWRGSEGLLPSCVVDPGWDDGGRSVGAANKELRDLLTMYLEFCFADRPDLLAKVVPEYPPAAKRLILDNGSWPATLKRSDVELVTEAIARVEKDAIVDVEGRRRPTDVIVLATGFEASDFLVPMRVAGRDGRDLREEWGGDARAHLGITVPGQPNFFMLYGPNTNIVVNGSIVYFTECEVHYVLSCLEHLVRTGSTWLEVTTEAHERHNREVDEGNAGMVWGVATVSSWYRNETGRTAQNWPFGLLDYWRLTRAVDPSEYVTG